MQKGKLIMLNNDLVLKFKDLAMLQKRLIDMYRKMLKYEFQVAHLITLLEKTEILTVGIIKAKEEYYERPLDWIEEKSLYYLQIIKKKIQDDDIQTVSVYIEKLIDCMGKSSDVLYDFIECGMYHFDLGAMKYDEKRLLQSKDELISTIDPNSMNPLEYFFFFGKHNFITKWGHYFEVYHRYFQKFRNKPVTVLEIGVFGGGSLQMWKDYFGKDCNIIGIDIMEQCKNYEEDQIKIYIGSQEDRVFLNKVKEENPIIDIIIDDGGHMMNQQIVSFEELYPHLSDGGVYLCEDCMTSYYPKYEGGYNNPFTFIEYSKKLIDKINARYSESKDLSIDELTRSIRSIHFHDAMVVFEKGSHMPTMEFNRGSLG